MLQGEAQAGGYVSLQKYIAVLRVSIANNLAYLAEVFFRALLLVVLVFIKTCACFLPPSERWREETGAPCLRFGLGDTPCFVVSSLAL